MTPYDDPVRDGDDPERDGKDWIPSLKADIEFDRNSRPSEPVSLRVTPLFRPDAEDRVPGMPGCEPGPRRIARGVMDVLVPVPRPPLSEITDLSLETVPRDPASD